MIVGMIVVWTSDDHPDDDDQSPSTNGVQRPSWGRATNTNNCETSVNGKDSLPSLPSHMGSAYGVEVTSLRGTSGNFINSKRII